jgi:hypothetical protein
MDWLLLEHIFVLVVILITINRLRQGDGIVKNITKIILGYTKQLSFVNNMMNKTLEEEANKTIQDMTKDKPKPT